MALKKKSNWVGLEHKQKNILASQISLQYVSVCLFVCLFVCPNNFFYCVSVCLFVCLFVQTPPCCLFVCLFVRTLIGPRLNIFFVCLCVQTPPTPEEVRKSRRKQLFREYGYNFQKFCIHVFL